MEGTQQEERIEQVKLPCAMVIPASQYYFLFCIPSPSFLNLFLLFYFWLQRVFVVECGLSLVVENRVYSGCGVGASHCCSFSYCRALSKCMGFVVVDSSRTRDQTHIPRIGRWIPNHWATRKVLSPSFVCTT